MTSSLVETSSASFVILSHPSSAISSPTPPLRHSSLQDAADGDQMAAVPASQVVHNPKSLIEITAKRAASSLQDLNRQGISNPLLVQRNCVSLTAGGESSIGPILVSSSPNISIDSTDMNNGQVEESNRSNGDSAHLTPSRKVSNASSSRHTEFELLSIEDVLIELRVENEKLKEVVDKNNAAMRRQLTIVQNWQKEVKSVKQAYEDLKHDSEIQIQQLKQVNADLRDTIECNISDQQQQQQQQHKIQNQENTETTTQTGDSLTAMMSAVNESADAQQLKIATHIPTAPAMAESSNYWWDMSMELAELRTRLDKINLLEQAVASKDDQVSAHQKEVKASQEIISRMEREIDQLRAEVINGSADASMISSLQSQVKIFMQSYADEQRRSQEFSEHVTRLLQELQQVREEKLDLELRLEGGCGAGPAGASDSASACEESMTGNVDEPVIDVGRSAGKALDGKHHHHRHHHRSHRREAKAAKASKKDSLKEAAETLVEPTGRYFKKLMKGANVANLTSGLKLKSFKDFGNPNA